MAINWSILQPVDIGSAYDEGWDRAQKIRDQMTLKSALAAYSRDPSDPAAISALTAASPEFAMKYAQNQWDVQKDERERQRLGALLGSDPTGIPDGLNGKPAQPNWRQRQQVALRAGDTKAAAALGAMADDQERRADIDQKKTVVTSKINPVTGAETYYDWQGTPIGDDKHPYVRDEQGFVHSHGWTPETDRPPPPPAPAPLGDALAPLPADQIAPAPGEPGATPSGSPVDPNLAQTPAFDLFGPLPPNALPNENMETYLIRKAKEQIAADPSSEPQVRGQLMQMVKALRSGAR